MSMDIIARGLAVKNKNDIQTNSTQIATITNKPDLSKYALQIIPTIDVNEAYAVNADSALTINPTVDSNGETVHPSPLFFPYGWNGWKYWLGINPYPNADGDYENPCIMVSNDGNTYQVPSGLTNPIFPKPTSGFYSDIFLVMSPDNSTMYMGFRQFDANINIWVAESTDGVNWSDKHKILSFVVTEEDAASPAIIWDGSQYVMWAVDLVASPKVIKKRTAQSIYGTWSEPSTCTIAAPEGKEFWHLDVLYTGSQYIMLLQTGAPGEFGSAGLLYLASSNDGDTWTVSDNPVLYSRNNYFDAALYRSGGILTLENGSPVIDLWYGCHGTEWKTARTKVKFDKTKMIANRDLILGKPLNTKIPLIAGDNFIRSDSAVGLGTSSSGHTWVDEGGTWGISNNQAYLPSAENSRAVIDVGVSDFEVVVEFAVLGDALWVIARYVDANNFFRCGYETGAYQLQKVKDGAVAIQEFITPSKAPTAGDKFKIICNGNTITAQKISNYGYCDFVDGELTITDADFNTATKVGISTANITTRVERFWANRL